MMKILKKIFGISDVKQEASRRSINNKKDGNMYVTDINMTAYQFFTETSDKEREQVLDEAVEGANRDQKAILEKYEKKYAEVR